jgi:hypothetical protein
VAKCVYTKTRAQELEEALLTDTKDSHSTIIVDLLLTLARGITGRKEVK